MKIWVGLGAGGGKPQAARATGGAARSWLGDAWAATKRRWQQFKADRAAARQAKRRAQRRVWESSHAKVNGKTYTFNDNALKHGRERGLTDHQWVRRNEAAIKRAQDRGNLLRDSAGNRVLYDGRQRMIVVRERGSGRIIHSLQYSSKQRGKDQFWSQVRRYRQNAQR